MDNNETLARYYRACIRQMIVLWPTAWVHDPYGDWSPIDISDRDRSNADIAALARQLRYG